MSESCFNLEINDDEIVEAEEALTLVIEAMDPNDIVDTNSTIFISDNDRKEITVCLHDKNYMCRIITIQGSLLNSMALC